MQDVKGKYALVTGASSGLGIDFAHELAKAGANLIIVARREELLNKLKKEIEAKYSVKVFVITIDLSQVDSADKLIKEVETLGLSIDILINNAGFGVYGEFIDNDQQRIVDMITLNITTLTCLTKQVLEKMKTRNQGHILLVASVAGFQPAPTYASYAATKAYVLNFGEALNQELSGSNINVTVLCPGATRTSFFDVSGQKENAYQKAVIMESLPVVKLGLKHLIKGTPSVVPGIINKLGVFFLRFTPRSVQAKAAQLLMRN